MNDSVYARAVRAPRVLILLAFLLFIGLAVVATRPASVRAEGGGALVAEPVLSGTAAGVSELFGATPAEASGEVWGVGRKSGELQTIVRYTESGGWESVAEPVEAEGRSVTAMEIPEAASAGRTTPAGGVVTVAKIGSEESQALLIRDPGGAFRAVAPPDVPSPAVEPPTEEPPAEGPPTEEPPAEGPPTEEPPAEGPPTEEPPAEGPPTEEPLFEYFQSNQPSWIQLAAVEEPDGTTGAFVVPPAQVNEAVLHYDGSGWSREPICVGEVAECEMSPLPAKAIPTSKFEVFDIDASGPGNAWLLAREVKSEGPSGQGEGVLLLHREDGQWRKQKLGGPLGERFGIERSTIGASKVFVNPRDLGQSLTVTSKGVWADAKIAVGASTGPAFEATIYLDTAEGDPDAGQVTGAWCNPETTTPVEVAAAFCSGELPSDLPHGQSRSFAWPGNGGPGEEFGTRAVTGVGKGAMLIFENGAFTRVPLAGNGGTVAGAALSSPEQGWLGPSYRLTREPIPSGLVSWPVPFRHPLTAIAPQPGAPVGELGSEALAVGETGQVARYEPGLGWQPESLGTGSGARVTPNLRGVAWPVPGLAFAVGDEGAMWIWRAGTDTWEPDPGAPPNLIRSNFTGIAFDPNEPERGYAVGQQGLLLGYGRSWTQEALPPEIGSEPNITSIAFAGNEAIATWSLGIPSKIPGRIADFTGGVIVNDGSGWRIEPQATELLATTEGLTTSRVSPRLAAGLPDGGAVVAGATGEIIERETAGAPWHTVPGAPLGFPAALAVVREGGQLRAIVAVEANTLGSFASSPFEVEEPQGATPPPEGQAPLLIEPYPLPGAGYVVRQTATGWRDEQRQSYPVPPVPTDQIGERQMDIPRTPDPVLALLVSPEGSRGWAVGGQTGAMASSSTVIGASEREGLQTAAAMRLGETATPPENTSTVPIPVPAGEATFAIGGNAQCADTCADLAGTGIGPDAWLEAAVGKAAATPGVRAFLYTGTSVAGNLNLGQISRSEFGDEEAAYAHRLGAAAGSLPVFTTPAESDLYESSLGIFGQKFEGFSAPLGKATPGSAILPTSEGERANGNYSYSFESSGSGPGEAVRVVVLDYATAPLGAEEQCWLAGQLSAAKSAAVPAIVVGNREVGTDAALSQLLVTGADETTALSCPQATPAAASAYFFDAPEANKMSTLAWGTATIPTYGTGSLGYLRIPELKRNEYVAASGFLLASVETSARNPSTNVAPVTARLVPSVGSLAIDALNGTLLRRSQTATFEALARRPQAGFLCTGNNLPASCTTVKPDPYVQIPARCRNQPSCPTEILPEYRFTSSRPDIANFVKVDPASNNQQAVFLNQEGKPEPDPTSGLLCTFNSGTTTVSVEAGGLSYSVPVTVQKGSVARPCGTVPRTDIVSPLPAIAAPLPPPTSQPPFKTPAGTLPPPVAPGVAPSPPVVPTPPSPLPIPISHPVPAKPPAPIDLPSFPGNPIIAPVPVIIPPAPPAAAEPAPPTGTSPVTQPAVSPEPEEEEEAAFDLVHHAVAVRHSRRQAAAISAYRYQPSGSSVPWLLYALPTLVVIAALSSSGIAGRRRRREPEPAFLQSRR